MQSFEEQKQNIPTPAKDAQTLAPERATESNAIEIPQISLPKGGGALRGIDEKFQVDPSNGTASFSIPLPISPGRNGFGPSLALSYNSGVGNGPFGIGWSLGLTSIKRKTEKELPKYQDGTQEDTFVISGMEDLVPFLEQDQQGAWKVKQSEKNGYTLKEYRPRQEGAFSRIEKVSHPDTGVSWRITNANNTVTIYGRSANCQIADPEDNQRIFEWLPEFSYDNQGNYIRYTYKEENLESVPSELYEKNRHSGLAPFTNKYLKRVLYGNKTAYYPDPALLYQANAPQNDPYCFELIFDYGEHHLEMPTPEEEAEQLWDYRMDPFSSYGSGFEIRTNRLCKRVLMFHHFEELNAGEPTLVRSLDLEYLSSEDLKAKSNRPAELTYLIGVSQKGYIRKPDGSYASKALPKMTFDYQWLNWNTQVKEVEQTQLQGSPIGLNAPYQWVDLYSEGINGILSEQSQGWFYKNNLGEDQDGKLSFTPSKPILPKPSMLGMTDGRLQLVDLEANGQKQIVARSNEGQAGYFELSHEEY
ncbi:MAG: SpvB/TcaC N-terminal domain-containing protein, partial [Bacteroidota bacterium]